MALFSITNRIGFCMIFACFPLALFSQTPAPQPVIIVQDSPQTEAERATGFRRWMEQTSHNLAMLNNTISTVQTGTRMVENQIRSAQSLAEGNWEGFVNAVRFQNAAMMDFAGALDGMAQVDWFDGVTNLPEFQELKEAGYDLADLGNASRNLVESINSMYLNSKQRLDAMSNLNDVARGQDMVGQMQIMNQQLGLLGGTITDSIMILQAGIELDEVARKQEQMERMEEIRNAEAFLFTNKVDSSVWSDNVNYDELQDLRRTGGHDENLRWNFPSRR